MIVAGIGRWEQSKGDGVIMKATAVWVVVVASAVVAFGLRGGAFGEGEETSPSDEEIKAAETIAAEVAQEKALKEQERKLAAEKHFNAATEALQQSNYDAAIEELTAALAVDPENETYQQALEGARVMKIRGLLSQKKFAEARDLCDQFLSEHPGNEQVARFREQAVAELEKPAVPAKEEVIAPLPTEAVQPTAEQLIVEAEDLILRKDYRKAQDKLLEARSLSPYDVTVNKMIKRLQEQLTRYERAYYNALREEMLTQIYEAWNKRPRRLLKPEMVEAGPAYEEPSEHRREILKKLEVIIPEVEFEDAKLTEVVDYLSKVVDVNIVVDPVVFRGGFSQPTTGLETVPGIPGGVSPGPTGPGVTPGGIPSMGGPTTMPSTTFGPSVTAPGETPSPVGTWIPPVTDTGITLRLKNVPLKDVLKYVLKWKNLKYVVEDYAILIAPIDYVPPESMETEIFRLSTTGVGLIQRPELSMTGTGTGTSYETGTTRGTRLMRGPTEIGGGPSTGTGLFGPEAEPGAVETIEDFLRTSGISWPMGSSITYIKRTGTLIVTNTPSNMVLIKELVLLWDQPALQVEIEARFVEILHTRWFENSFQAQMLAPLIFSKSGVGTSGVNRRFEFEAHPERGTRFFPQLLPMEFPTPDADAILSLRGIMTEPDFQFIWRAIDQRDWSDLLSAPRITTISGQQAQIEVVQELTYPTEYDTETINIGGGWGGTTNLISGEVFMVTPGNWEKRDVGIILNVTPTVSADGKMISLVLMPEVTDLVSWINYGNEIYPINQPVFETRNITTSVYVNDGETIVLGGLITDKTTTYQDKVPLLGSIPFVGRFFRSTAETSAKANLVVFVTARLITSRGTEVAVERAFSAEQARQLEKRIRERKEEAGEIAPGVGTTGLIQ